MLHSDERCGQTREDQHGTLVQMLIFFASGAGIVADRAGLSATLEPARSSYKAHGKHVIMYRSFCRISI